MAEDTKTDVVVATGDVGPADDAAGGGAIADAVDGRSGKSSG
jgi:hypothetical protein